MHNNMNILDIVKQKLNDITTGFIGIVLINDEKLMALTGNQPLTDRTISSISSQYTLLFGCNLTESMLASYPHTMNACSDNYVNIHIPPNKLSNCFKCDKLNGINEIKAQSNYYSIPFTYIREITVLGETYKLSSTKS